MSFFNSSTSTGAGTSTTTATPDKDLEVAEPPTDSISSLAFSPQAEYLAVGSWDNNVCLLAFYDRHVVTELLVQVRIYEVGATGQTQGKAMYSHQAPVLSVCWTKVRLIMPWNFARQEIEFLYLIC